MPMHRPTIIAGAIAVSIVALGAAVWLFSDRIPAREVRDATQFARIRAGLDRPVFSRFPRAIPANATEPRFFYSPGFLRRPTLCELRFVLPRSALDALAAQSAKVAADVADQSKGAAILPQLRLLDDGDSATPPPKGLQSWILSHPAPNQWSGMVLNPETGEVLLWAIDN